MKLNARDEVVAEGSKIAVNGATVRVSVFHGYALRGAYYTWNGSHTIGVVSE